jgi:hypothetical protein
VKPEILVARPKMERTETALDQAWHLQALIVGDLIAARRPEPCRGLHGPAASISSQVVTFALRVLPSIWSLRFKKGQKALHNAALLC